jgi:hypothetical protein
LVTFLATALKAAVAVLAITAVRRDIASKTAPTRERLSAETAMPRVTRAESALFLETILVLSALTARKWATLRSVARSQLPPRRMSVPVMVEGMLVTLAMLEPRLPTTPAAVATSVVPLVVIAGVVEAARLLQPAEAGRFDAFLDAACCRLSLCDDGHDERIHSRMVPSKASLSVSCQTL